MELYSNSLKSCLQQFSLFSDDILLQHMNYWKIFRFSTYHKYKKKPSVLIIYCCHESIIFSVFSFPKNRKYLKQLQKQHNAKLTIMFYVTMTSHGKFFHMVPTSLVANFIIFKLWEPSPAFSKALYDLLTQGFAIFRQGNDVIFHSIWRKTGPHSDNLPKMFLVFFVIQNNFKSQAEPTLQWMLAGIYLVEYKSIP